MYGKIIVYDLTDQDKVKIEQKQAVDLDGKISYREVGEITDLAFQLSAFSGGMNMIDCLTFETIGGPNCPGNEHHDMRDMLSGNCPLVNNGSFIPDAETIVQIIADQDCLNGNQTGPNDPSNGNEGDPNNPGNYEPIGGDGGNVENPPSDSYTPQETNPNEQNPTDPSQDIGDDSVITTPFIPVRTPELTHYPSTNIEEVNELLLENPFSLLNIPCNQIQYWQAIAQHQVPQSVKNKIENIDSQTGWFTSAGIQTLNDSNNGAVVNMDFFPITITQMPNKPNGQPYTQKELFDYIRTHINDFFDDLVFTPVVNTNYNLNDSELWLSNNPLGAI